jgi:hypothetical protein
MSGRAKRGKYFSIAKEPSERDEVYVNERTQNKKGAMFTSILVLLSLILFFKVDKSMAAKFKIRYATKKKLVI